MSINIKPGKYIYISSLWHNSYQNTAHRNNNRWL